MGIENIKNREEKWNSFLQEAEDFVDELQSEGYDNISIEDQKVVFDVERDDGAPARVVIQIMAQYPNGDSFKQYIRAAAEEYAQN